jgi:tripartite ATP-independent transporter DctM subunit
MDFYIGLVGIGCFLFLVILGMPVAFAGALIGGAGIFLLKGLGGAIGALGYLPFALTSKYTFGVIPMFILMGFFASEAGLATNVYRAIKQWIGHISGGLAIATVFGCAAFGATSGSSTASAAVFGKIAIPELRKNNYDPTLAAGTVAASGTLASIIPPSMLIVIYCLLTEESVAELLVAGVIPGILSAVIYAVMLWCRIKLDPRLGPPIAPFPWKERLNSLKGAWGMALIFVLLVGGIYTGIFTPTEAGAVAAFSSFLIALALGELTFSRFRAALIQTGSITVMVFAVLVGTLIFMHFLALSGVTRVVIGSVAGLPVSPILVICGMLFVYLIIGCFVSATAMIMLTMPMFYPVIVSLGLSPIWFGIVVIKMCEIAVITPPLGLNVYAVKSVTPDISTTQIFKGIFPFLAMDIFTLAMLVAFPQITLFLPQKMK